MGGGGEEPLEEPLEGAESALVDEVQGESGAQ